MDTEHETQVAALQAKISEQHVVVTAAERGTRQHSAALDALIAATEGLLEFEDELPALLDGSSRRVSVWVTRAAAAAGGAGVVVAAVCVFWGPLGWGWYLPAVAGAVLVATLTLTGVRPAGGGHRKQRLSALVGMGAAVALAPAGVWLGWWSGLLLTMVLLGVVFTHPDVGASPADGQSDGGPA